MHSFSQISLISRFQTSLSSQNKFVLIRYKSIIYFACLFVFLHPINVRTTEQTWSKFVVRPDMTPGKVYGDKFNNLFSTKFTKKNMGFFVIV